MQLLLIAALVVASVAAAVWGTRKIRIAIAASLFACQMFILLVSFGGAARSVVLTQQETADNGATLFLDGVSRFQDALFPLQLKILLASCGLMVLVIAKGRND